MALHNSSQVIVPEQLVSTNLNRLKMSLSVKESMRSYENPLFTRSAFKVSRLASMSAIEMVSGSLSVSIAEKSRIPFNSVQRSKLAPAASFY